MGGQNWHRGDGEPRRIFDGENEKNLSGTSSKKIRVEQARRHS